MTTRDFEDLTVGAKIRFATETVSRPAMAVRFSTRLPNANNESGLGLDTTDFHFNLLLGKTVQSVRIVGNFGFGILADPVRGDSQNDVMDYGASVARAVRPGVEVVGEVNGRLNTRNGVPPIGTESRSLMRLGTRYTRGAVRVDAAVILGVTALRSELGLHGWHDVGVQGVQCEVAEPLTPMRTSWKAGREEPRPRSCLLPPCHPTGQSSAFRG